MDIFAFVSYMYTLFIKASDLDQTGIFFLYCCTSLSETYYIISDLVDPVWLASDITDNGIPSENLCCTEKV